MRVPVVDVGIVRVGVPHGLVPVGMAVRLPCRIARRVTVSVVLVVDVQVVVLHWLVDMLVGVPFGQVQPDPQTH